MNTMLYFVGIIFGLKFVTKKKQTKLMRIINGVAIETISL